MRAKSTRLNPIRCHGHKRKGKPPLRSSPSSVRVLTPLLFARTDRCPGNDRRPFPFSLPSEGPPLRWTQVQRSANDRDGKRPLDSSCFQPCPRRLRGDSTSTSGSSARPADRSNCYPRLSIALRLLNFLPRSPGPCDAVGTFGPKVPGEIGWMGFCERVRVAEDRWILGNTGLQLFGRSLKFECGDCVQVCVKLKFGYAKRSGQVVRTGHFNNAVLVHQSVIASKLLNRKTIKSVKLEINSHRGR